MRSGRDPHPAAAVAGDGHQPFAVGRRLEDRAGAPAEGAEGAGDGGGPLGAGALVAPLGPVVVEDWDAVFDDHHAERKPRCVPENALTILASATRHKPRFDTP